MTKMRIDEHVRNAVNEAVAFSAKAENSPQTRNRIMLRLQKGQLTVLSVGTAGEIFARRSACSYDGADACAVVNGSVLASLLAPAGREAELVLSGTSLELRDGLGSAKLFLLSSDDVSLFCGILEKGEEDLGREPSAVIPLSALRTGIREVLYARSDRNSRSSYATCGVTLSLRPDRMEIWAVDKTRAAKFSCECTGKRNCTCVIPADIAAFLAGSKWLEAGADGSCRLTILNDRFLLETEEVLLISPTVPGTIFEFDKAVNLGADYSTFTFRASDMLATLGAILSVCAGSERGSASPSVIGLAENGLQISFQNPAGEIVRTIPAEMQLSRADAASRKSCRIGVNTRLLRDGLTACAGQRVVMCTDVSAANRCILLRPLCEDGPRRMHLILPVYLKPGRD